MGCGSGLVDVHAAAGARGGARLGCRACAERLAGDEAACMRHSLHAAQLACGTHSCGMVRTQKRRTRGALAQVADEAEEDADGLEQEPDPEHHRRHHRDDERHVERASLPVEEHLVGANSKRAAAEVQHHLQRRARGDLVACAGERRGARRASTQSRAAADGREGLAQGGHARERKYSSCDMEKKERTPAASCAARDGRWSGGGSAPWTRSPRCDLVATPPIPSVLANEGRPHGVRGRAVTAVVVVGGRVRAARHLGRLRWRLLTRTSGSSLLLRSHLLSPAPPRLLLRGLLRSAMLAVGWRGVI